MMKKYLNLIAVILVLSVISCNSTKEVTRQSFESIELNDSEQSLVDSILQYGLDHEALYTLLSDIKPMSSLKLYYLPIANTDSSKQTEAEVVDVVAKRNQLDRLRKLQSAVNKLNDLNIPDLKFILVPYNSAQKEMRVIQLSVIRRSLLDKILLEKESFFGQFGLAPGADPIVVASMVENADRYERYRAYGYLFGYPDYAVDFYVKASLIQVQTKKFPERTFFQIPVYKGDSGYFVYAYPKNHTPTASVDSVLYNKAVGVLDDYKNIRNKYLRSDSTLKASQLLRDLYTKP